MVDSKVGKLNTESNPQSVIDYSPRLNEPIDIQIAQQESPYRADRPQNRPDMTIQQQKTEERMEATSTEFDMSRTVSQHSKTSSGPFGMKRVVGYNLRYLPSNHT